MTNSRTTTQALIFASSVAVLAGCETGGLFPLGAKRDTLVPCTGETSTWLRSTAERTEFIVLGSTNPTAQQSLENPKCFAFGWVAHNSDTHMEAGSYWLAAGGTGEAFYNDSYDFRYNDSSAIISRTGAYRTTTPAPAIVPLTIQAIDARHVDITYQGERHRYRAMGDVVEAIDLDSQQGAEDLFRLVNLPLFTSQVRVNGFGSGRMTQYILSEPAVFRGLIANDYTLQVQSALSPHTTFVYRQFRDMSGITIDGTQRTLVNAQGDGPMDGTISYVLEGMPLGGGVPNPLIRGSLTYDDITIDFGVAAGGTFSIDPDGAVGPRTAYSIPYTLATNVDLRALIPVVTP